MSILTTTFNVLLYQPLFNALILIYNFLPGNDFGLAIITLTFFFRLALYPVMAKSIKYQQTLNKIQPEMKEIQEKFKDDQEKQAREIMRIYKENEISPFSVFLPLLIQLPLLIALFQVFKTGLQPEAFNNLYGFISSPGQISYFFLGIVSLTEPNIILAVLTAATQFFQVKLTQPKKASKKEKVKDGFSQFAEMSQRQMPYFLAAFTFVFLARLPAALGLYWITTSLFSIAQQNILKNNAKPK